MTPVNGLPKVDCPTLQKNLDSVTECSQILFSRAGTSWDHTLDLAKFETVVGEEALELLPDIYGELPTTFFSKFQIEETVAEHVGLLLNVCAFGYLSIVNGTNLKLQFDVIDSYFERLDRANIRMETLLSPEVEKIDLLMKIFSLGDENANDYAVIVREYLDCCEKLKRLRPDFRNTPLVKRLSLNQPFSIRNPGLREWMENIFDLWTLSLNRSIENKSDGKNGRKHLLAFAVDTMELLNPSLEYHSLDNMLRKVQTVRKKTGERPSLKNSDGRISPLRDG